MNIDERPRTDDRRPTDQRPTTDLRVNSHILGKFQMAITLQRVNRSLSCLVLGWSFRGRRIERRHFRLDQIQDGGRRPSWKTSNGHISNALSDSLYVCTQTILCPRSLIYNDGDSKLISYGRVTCRSTLCFKKKFTLFVFTISKSDVNQF